jgi:hypothetical protein
MLEVLMAVAIALAFLGGAVLAFSEIIRAADRSQARLNAIANGRHALDRMTVELTRADPGTPEFFIGSTTELINGDYADNDGDGEVDEESVNGLDDDNDWVVTTDDKHAELQPGLFERQRFLNKPDLDDIHVDEDVKFTSADMQFRTYPDSSTTGTRHVRFLLGNYDGEANVLLQEVTTDVGGPEQTVTTAPLAFNVMSFSALYWDQGDSDPDTRYWKTTWDASSVDTSLPPLPVVVHLAVTVYSGYPDTPGTIVAGTPFATETVSTNVMIEGVKGDPLGRYDAIRETY